MWEKFKKKVRAVRSAEVGGINIGNILMLGIGMIFIAVGFIIYPVILEGTDSVLESKNDTSDSGNITTAGVITTGNITLSKTLFDSDVAYVISVSSNISETPVSDNFTAGKLFLSSLSGNTTRTITAAYYYGNIGDFTGLEPVTKVIPLIVLIGFVSAGVITGFFGIKNVIKG